ncbi:MAG: wax ester/triacylglycerol synthase domain-containing protein [Actinomycetota bacterium]
MNRDFASHPRIIARASPNDLTNLAVDRGPTPMNIGAVLVLEGATDLGLPAIRPLLDGRLPRVRRLRQRLVLAPLGGGRPLWVDDADFDLDCHLSAHVAEPGDDAEASLLRVAAGLVCEHLPRDRPLWHAGLVTVAGTGKAALVLVVHHVLADGLGGLAVLVALADEGTEPPPAAVFPELPPPRRELIADAWRQRARTLRRSSLHLRSATHGVRELGLATRPRLAPATSLNRPTGPRRRLTTVNVPLSDVVDFAHARGCTVNDIALAAIVGAMAGTLESRGERPAELVVSVPISSRRGTTAGQLGNQTGVVPLTLPTTPDPVERLDRIAAISRARRGSAPGASAAPLGLAFRALGRLGLFQPFIDRQRLVNTFVTNVRGPTTAMTLGGRPVVALIPIAVNPGNVGVSFDILSYGGLLGITVVADPDVVPDQDRLTDLLARELTELRA